MLRRSGRRLRLLGVRRLPVLVLLRWLLLRWLLMLLRWRRLLQLRRLRRQRGLRWLGLSGQGGRLDWCCL